MLLNLFYIVNHLLVLTFAFKCSEVSRFDIENHLSTKTPYRVIANKNDKEIKFKGCTPVKIWAVIRHGTRNPGKKDITQCKENLTRIREKILKSSHSKLCPHEFALFRNWSCNLHIDEAKFLVYEGEDELIELAERMQNRFPTLLVEDYSLFHYKFKYTLTQRTLKSAQSFAIGLFGRNNIKKIIYPEAVYNDPILRFYKLCKRWLMNIDENPNVLYESRKFLEGKEMRKLVKTISNRIGFFITSDDVMLMYKFCAFETAWNKKRFSPWCTLFQKDTIEIPEFAEDLGYYWNDGYGHELTYKQACPAIQDMMAHINPNSTRENATFYFTHSGTILKMLAHLNLYQDDFVLTHQDFKKHRKWKVSKIDSFASNIAFVTFNCGNESKVLVLHQERVVRLPGCPEDNDLCSFKTLEKIFRHSVDNCKFEEMCQI